VFIISKKHQLSQIKIDCKGIRELILGKTFQFVPWEDVLIASTQNKSIFEKLVFECREPYRKICYEFSRRSLPKISSLCQNEKIRSQLDLINRGSGEIRE